LCHLESPNSMVGVEEMTEIEVSWDDILRAIGPMLMQEAIESELKSKLESRINQIAVVNVDGYETSPFSSFMMGEDFETVVIQLFALGLIVRGRGKAVLGSGNSTWKLTPYGNSYVLQLKAIRRNLGGS
jgi:hypothetical protein